MMDSQSEECNLKDLFREYEVTLRLKQHDKIPTLTSRICKALINLYDSELLGTDSSSNGEDEEESAVDLHHQDTIENMCQRIREISQLATAYQEVIEFASVYDMVCLSRLVGVLPETKETTRDLQVKPIDIDESLRVLRKSILLLRTINYKDKSNPKVLNMRISKEDIKSISGCGFPVLEIILRKQSSKDVELNYEDNSANEDLTSVLNSDWFQSFSSSISKYPLDRFTILVAVWIIADQCKHTTLERLIGELVEQIHHEEANSCSEEELLLLTQVGSFWLSYYKRFDVTMKGANQMVADEYEEDDGDNLDLNDSSLSIDSSESSVSLLTRNQEENNQKVEISQPVDLRSQLRKLIDEELLYGVACPLCDYRQEELLSPLNCQYCQRCGNGSDFRCGISYQPLGLIPLTSLTAIRPQLSTLVVVTHNEWIRHLLSSSLKLRLTEFNDRLTKSERIVERVDISKTFERLTMIRDGELRKGSDSSLSDDSEDEIDSNLNNSKIQQSTREYQNIIGNFMNLRVGKTDPQSSESLRLIRYTNKQSTVLPICGSDLYVLDSKNSSYHLLMNTSNNLIQLGTIWSCSTRSTVSTLMIGCARLFSSVELARLGQSTLTQYTCPTCELPLTELININFAELCNL